MSYILDALKKSEQQRKKGKIPDLNTIQDLSGGKNKPARPPWLLILIAAVALNGLLFSIWLYSDQPDSTTTTVASSTTDGAEGNSAELENTAANSSAESVAADETPLTTIEEAAAVDPATEIAPENTEPGTALDLETVAAESPLESTEADTPTEQTPDPADEFKDHTEDAESAERDPNKAVSFEDLPSGIKDDLPPLKISLHYYSASPSSRMASVNGRMMREGQEVTKGLMIREITKDGIIFSFDNTLFSYEVFSR